MEELKARYFLNASNCLSLELQSKILNHFGCALDFLHSSEAPAFIGPELWERLRKTSARLEHDKAFDRLVDQNVKFLLKESPEYPPQFNYLDTAPHLLYYKGNLPESFLPSISIVGTRRPTLYGQQMAQLFASELAAQGLHVVSGLAKGIDSIALKAALETGGSTIAFLGTGIDRVYPAENKRLFDDMEARGLILSEFSPGSAPLKQNFPYRNRLISAMGLGVVVVEAGLPSGTLVTVRWALSQGKDCFAIPGPANSPSSKGNHQMIREGAFLVEHPQEILDYFASSLGVNSTKASDLETQLSAPQEELQEQFGLDKTPYPIEHFMASSGLDWEDVNKVLNRAVLAGHVERHPGDHYSLKIALF